MKKSVGAAASCGDAHTYIHAYNGLLYIHSGVCACVCVYIYIYIYRERERERGVEENIKKVTRTGGDTKIPGIVKKIF